MTVNIESPELTLKTHSRSQNVKLVEIIAYSIIFANVVNLFFVRLGLIPDVLLLATSLLAFLWTMSEGIETRRIHIYLFAIAALFFLYLMYSALQLSYDGFRNAAAIFAAASTFLFFFRAASHLCASTGFFVALFVPFASFALLWEIPFAVGKNFINAAMCYYLIAVFLCYPGLRKLSTRHVTLLFFLIFVISLMNGHRTLAGSSIVLLLQYYVLSLNVARTKIRFLMFTGLVIVVTSVIALIVNPDMAVFTRVLDEFVTGEGGRTVNSGRQILWPVVWQAIAEHRLTGMGPGVVVSDIYTTPWSAHNLYLQIGLQVGYVGFGLVFLIFWSLWRAARPTGLSTTRTIENLMAVVITMVVVHSLFDVFLLQNAMAVGVPVWMVLGLGLGILANETKVTETVKNLQIVTSPSRIAQIG